jgi:hypothetical protein
MKSRRHFAAFGGGLLAVVAIAGGTGCSLGADEGPFPPAGQGGSGGTSTSGATTGGGRRTTTTTATTATTAGSGSGNAGAGGTSGSTATAGTGGAPDAGGQGGASRDAGSSDASRDAGTFSGDTFVPWFGGPPYYGKWPRGLPADPAFFPVGVWLQTPTNAKRYAAVGIDVFIGLYAGPTQTNITALAAASMFTVCDQSADWKANVGGNTIRGWLQPDEPDNAQPLSGGGYGPCIAPATIIAGRDAMIANDATRPVLLGLGRGVADTNWVGRGSCTGKTDMYAEYAKGADILAFDIYPVNEGVPLEMVPAGVDNLLKWSGRTKPVISDIEASNFNDTTRPTPAQIKSEVWMALVHGAAGIQYFCHRFKPTFSETDCLDDAPTAAALPTIDAQIKSLAPVLNTQSVANGVAVTSSIPVDTMLKRYGGATYLFAAEMRTGTTRATFKLRDFPPSASAEVIGENRSIVIAAGSFDDDFDSYGVHLYRIAY